ncbi:hypothetical protein Goari_012205 [Gossypium aridum]|uniref:HTH myb-type domain-containing protein n=1 Tax=Gossypium aridum TaxID=34290 RepID=A0A7J8WZT6_GOSAI|nr:hypothetical protein [Gossypium aridum]
MFLLGLQKLGKGDWRGISRNYVISRTPTQVASHAQKYFIRQSNVSRRKRRSSLFDIVADEVSTIFSIMMHQLPYLSWIHFISIQFDCFSSCVRDLFLVYFLQSSDTPMASQDLFSANHPHAETQSNDQLSIPPTLDEEDKSMDSNNSNDGETVPPKSESSQPCYPVVYPTYFPPFFPYSLPYWMGYDTEPTKKDTHEVVKPTAVHSKSPINVDELVGMSKLSLGESIGDSGSSSLSLKLDGSSRQSAFHANPASSGNSNMDSSGNPIHAV